MLSPLRIMRNLKISQSGSCHLKFVRVDEDDYRFCSMFISHADLLDPGEEADSAGFVYIEENNGFITVKVPMDQPSHGLSKWPTGDDYKVISVLFEQAWASLAELDNDDGIPF